jgi:threonyl-tRNA synthetase
LFRAFSRGVFSCWSDAASSTAIWNELKAQQAKELAAREKKAIVISLPDGKKIDGVAWETTPLKVAENLPKAVAKAAIVARVNGDTLWDLGRPLEDSCNLELLKWDDPAARDTFWHSSAHILGQALERVYGGFLCTGPPIEGGGFFYDMGMGSKTVSPSDFPAIQQVVDEIIKEKQQFERMWVPKDKALEMFGFSPYKTEILTTKVPDSDAEGVGAMCSVYRCGNLVDLCRGPHIADTGRAAAFQVWKSSSSYWKGDSKNDSLQRVYGIAFPEKKLLDDWQKQQAALEAMSHTAIGTKQQLFFIEPNYSPGSTFWLPHGARIYNKLISFIRGEYVRFGFTEVITPNMYNNALWTTSGHFPKYEKDMFLLDVDKEKFALKPMNCPGISISLCVRFLTDGTSQDIVSCSSICRARTASCPFGLRTLACCTATRRAARSRASPACGAFSRTTRTFSARRRTLGRRFAGSSSS